MFKNILRIQVEEAFPAHVKGRPRLLGFDDAYEDILQVVRTGMQWRHLRPKRVSYITVFKTGVHDTVMICEWLMQPIKGTVGGLNPVSKLISKLSFV